MPAPDYEQELRQAKFPRDENARSVAVLYVYDPSTNTFAPASSTSIAGSGQVLNANLVGGVMQVENLQVVMEAAGLLDNSSPTPRRINPATEDTLNDILETLGGGTAVNRFSLFDSENVGRGTTPTVVLDYVVPVGMRFRIDSIRGWANVDAEYSVFIDTLQVDGYRTTPAQLTMNIGGAAIQHASAGQHIIVSALHGQDNTYLVKAVVQGVLETI